MEKFLIEVPRGTDKESCDEAIQVFFADRLTFFNPC